MGAETHRQDGGAHNIGLGRDRFHLVGDVIDRVPSLGARAAHPKQAIRNKLLEHGKYISRHGDDMPEIAGWMWGQTDAARSVRSTEADHYKSGAFTHWLKGAE